MAKLEAVARNRTLAAIDKIIEDNQIDILLDEENEPRLYLGMSQVGHECNRHLYYSYRQAKLRVIDARGLKAIADGHRAEKIAATRLRLLPGVELITLVDGNQIHYSLHGGHFSGHLDGVIRGILEAPKTWHVWENKAVNEKKFNDLEKWIELEGEKNALEHWDYNYYCQAISYMHCATLDRHYLTVQTPGGRDWTSCRTEYDETKAQLIIDKAESIIFSNAIPARISEKREYYKCKLCDYQNICHDNAPADINCGTCLHRHPIENGVFYCGLHKYDIKNVFKPCKDHAFLSCFVHEPVAKVKAAFRGKEVETAPDKKVWEAL